MMFKDKNEFENEIIKYIEIDNKNVYINININTNKLKKETAEKPTQPEQIVLEKIPTEQTIDFNFDLIEIISDIKSKNKEFQDEELSYFITSNNIIYKKEVSYNNCDFIKLLKFLDSKFEKRVQFYDIKSIRDLQFHSCEFLEYIEFFNTTFESSLKFFKSEINNIIFKDCFFNNTDFIIDEPIFIEQASLKLEDLKSETTSKINISYNMDNSNSINKYPKEFTFTKIDKKISIILKNIICGNINLSETENEENIKLINCNFINCFDTETASILKNIEYKKSNTIKALEYKAKEMSKHKEELLNKPNKTFKDFGDIFSIYLSSLYSDNGLNWIKSIIVTIMLTSGIFSIYYSILKNTCHFIIMILVFLIFIRNIKKCVSIYIYIIIFIFSLIFIDISVYYVYISILNKNIQNINFIYEYYEYLNPTNYKELKYLKEVNFIKQIFAGLFYFLGKIAFWYGSVQTVQSFRKFSKKE